MGFQYEDEELELIYKGKTYKFRAPSALEQRMTSKKFREAGPEADAVELYLEFFADLGLPRDILEKMSMKGLMDLFSYALGSKKN